MAKQHTGDELLVFDGMPIGYSLSDFWRWNSSDLLSNTLRGAYAEFVVSSALDVDLTGTNADWGAYDITFPFRWFDGERWRNEIRIEVKCSAYLQSWNENKLSNIIFSIRPTRAWNPTDGYGDEVRRQSDVYVFCVYTETNRAEANPIVLDGWDFYIVPTRKLNDICGAQKSISLPSLLHLDPIKADYSGIKDAIVDGVRSYPPPPSICITFIYNFCS